MSKRTFDEYSNNDHYYSVIGSCGSLEGRENTSKRVLPAMMQTESSDDFMDGMLINTKEKVSAIDYDETPSNFLNIEPNLPDFVHMMESKKRKIDLESSIQQSIDSFEDLFFKAINNGDLDCLLVLLRQVPTNFDINMPNHIHPFKDQPALHIACNCGYTDFLKLLLEHFKPTLNINLENSKGSRSIHFAAYGGSLQILITLVGHVARYCHVNGVDLTFQQGKEFIFQGRNTEIYITPQNARVIHEFVNSKTNDENQRTPLIIATEKGNTDAVQFLLSLDKALREACPELQDATTIGTQGSYLPIHKAASRNNTEIIQLLLEHNPGSVNAKTSKRKFPSSFITSSNQVIYRGFSQTQFKRSEEKKQEESRSEEQSQQQQEEKKSYFKRLFSPANLILPAVFGIVLYNFASYDVRQKKREAELEKQASSKAVKAVGAPKLGGAFTLVNTKGEVVTDSEFRGKFMFMYFGFTNCPDVCPTEMKKMTKALQKIEKENPELADKIVPVFVSCDPPRDSCTAVIEYLQDYHPRFVGLTGTPDQISRICKKYRVYYNAPDYKEGSQDYLVDHSIFIYLMDPYGHLSEYFAQNTTADKIYESVSTALKSYKWE
ncbi:predicted protein [Naegleria gruberi]|uniref:Predicted protein n=1 Tax=Naegleria gruberi TaxID=5762 RepID=D2VQH7_NAEGR|nr:uncharacterized protein NAEGRDRAFT_51459 [Naegleria gruberi]EFC40872.1 predicted protein [Naegleria gruberi]|eukprot:XP_002673616.1 predicted protein [Naegleria gruberi strain NEG-M]